MVKIYSPGVFRLSDARQIEIKGDDVVRDADVKIDLTVLHSIRGRVVAKEDQHELPRFSVRLESETDASLGFNGTGGADGTFSIDYVPTGTYTLIVERAADTVPDETQPFRARITNQYEAAKVSVTVGEHDVVVDDILLVEKQPEAKDAPH